MAAGTPPGNLTGRRAKWLARALRGSLRRLELGRGTLFATALALQLGGAALLVWIGYVHWRLWQLGYKDIHIDGPFFLVDAIVAAALAVTLIAWPRPLVGLPSAGFTASTIAALLVSLRLGLFGFHESISASYVVESLVLESVAAAVLFAWTVIAASAIPLRNLTVDQSFPADAADTKRPERPE
jgi:hypothetical protein